MGHSAEKYAEFGHKRCFFIHRETKWSKNFVRTHSKNLPFPYAVRNAAEGGMLAA